MDLTPEMMQALLGNAAYDDQQKMLEAQIAHARAMGMQRGERHTTGGGAALGGLGDVINAKNAHDTEQLALARQQQMQEAYIKALQAAAQPPQQPAPGLPQTPAGMDGT